jgi:hypothetical protein
MTYPDYRSIKLQKPGYLSGQAGKNCIICCIQHDREVVVFNGNIVKKMA